MAGVRVQHPTHRNVRFNVVEPDIPYKKRTGEAAPYQCTPPEFGGCGSVHLFKTHHLNLDETGSVIVGDVLYQRIKGLLALHGFVESNPVERPPTMGIGLGPQRDGTGAWGNIPIIRPEGQP